ncbi:hypothetical protein D9619_000005 [Psilocybe cf. subviscida]|uniref:NADH:flavin oxidoreductase/NADH oxidase N-terminal domain-containing protein n=1 Tax=Psilocybe cf. subviscida TaxID=2480587 RepID=A0A8H5BE18_9AGAR|nr:hypothetical protein D9619_000005 [Psilocybe cf. subviscida]
MPLGKLWEVQQIPTSSSADTSRETMSRSQLFQPIVVGAMKLQHRVVLAPLTRLRATADKEHVPVNPLMSEYYSQRGRRPGTLLISEGTIISLRAAGLNRTPGIWSEKQITEWKKITAAVHAKGSYIYLQISAVGRAARPDNIQAGGYDVHAPSPIPIKEGDPVPRELTLTEIHEYVDVYAQAASNAVHKAGFDGVELHGANGYFIDQFLQSNANQRKDAYGGSVENRSRFGLEVVDAVVKAIGEQRTAIRLSPWSTYQSMKMADPKPQFTHFVSALKASYPDFSYIHLVEPEDEPTATEESNDFIRDIWLPRPLITCQNYNRETAIKQSEKTGELIAFGRWFIANPDLPDRIEKDIPFTPFNVNTFYTSTEEGYIDYPFAEAK